MPAISGKPRGQSRQMRSAVLCSAVAHAVALGCLAALEPREHAFSQAPGYEVAIAVTDRSPVTIAPVEPTGRVTARSRRAPSTRRLPDTSEPPLTPPAAEPPTEGEDHLATLTEARAAEPVDPAGQAPQGIDSLVGSALADGAGVAASGVGSGGEGETEGGRRGRRPPELAGRVIGGGRARVVDGVAHLSLAESNGLRTRDHFPRLPAALWPSHRPYLLAFEVCVDAAGQVDAATLLRGRVRDLDERVLAAVKTWRYRTRFAGGLATPFCHQLLVRYERAD